MECTIDQELADDADSVTLLHTQYTPMFTAHLGHFSLVIIIGKILFAF